MTTGESWLAASALADAYGRYTELMRQLASRNRLARTQLAVFDKQIEIRGLELEKLQQTPADFAPPGTSEFQDFAWEMLTLIRRERKLSAINGYDTWHRHVLEQLWAALATSDTAQRKERLVYTAALLHEWICLLDLKTQAEAPKEG